MKIKKISLTSLSNREINRKEKSILSGGQEYCGCAGVCWSNCACTYIELMSSEDFMGQAAHLETYDKGANKVNNEIIDPQMHNIHG